MVQRLKAERYWPVLRDVLAFCLGAYGVVIQLQKEVKDPVTLAFCAGLMGVPAMLGLGKNPDEK